MYKFLSLFFFFFATSETKCSTFFFCHVNLYIYIILSYIVDGRLEFIIYIFVLVLVFFLVLRKKYEAWLILGVAKWMQFYWFETIESFGTKIEIKTNLSFFFCQASELSGEVAGACTIHTIVWTRSWHYGGACKILYDPMMAFIGDVECRTCAASRRSFTL
jgi:hypothetical protein